MPFITNSAPPQPRLDWRSLWFSVLLPWLALAPATLGLCVFTYDATRRVVTENIANDMRAIAKLKVGQIEHWLAERQDDAQLIATAQFSHDLQQWLAGNMRDEHLKRRLLEQVTIPDTHLEPRTFTLRSADEGKVLLTTDSAQDSAQMQRLARQAAQLGRMELDDMHFAAGRNSPGHTHPKIRMGYFTPLLAGEGGKPLAVLHVSISPENVLYPLLLNWPGLSTSAETMLLRKEGENIVYLNDLRHAPDSALRLTRPTAAQQLIANRVIREGEGFFEDEDYRGIPCLAYGKHVQGTPWLLIAKIDRSEAYRQLNAIATVVAALCALVLLLCFIWLLARKREELRLSALLNECEDLYQHAPCGYHSLDKDGVFLRANETQLTMLGYERDEIIGKMNIRRLLTEASLRKFQEYMPRVVAFETITDVEFELVRKDGSIMPVLVSASAFRDRDGNFLMTRTMIYDISERKAMETQLRRSEERFRTLFRSIRDQVFVREALPDGTPGRLTEVNDIACQITGYSRAELQTLSPRRLYPALFDEVRYQQLRQQLADTGNVIFEDVQQTKDGRTIPVEINVSNLLLHGQAFSISLIRDISGRKQNEESLRLLRRAIEASAHGLIIGAMRDNAPPRIIYANPAFERITGYQAAEVLGMTTDLLRAEDWNLPVLAELESALRQQSECTVTMRNFRKDGTPFWNEMRVSPVLDESGKATHYVGLLSDVTSRLAIEAELVDSRERLRKLASHDDGVREAERKHIARELHDELGQSLTVLKMNIALLQMQFDQVPGLIERTEEMRVLVENTISVVRNAVSDLRPAALDLGIVGALEWLADDFTHHTGVECNYDGQRDEPILGDKLATVVFRIAQESLTNVARHAAARQVSIHFACNDGILCMSVADDGCGFDPASVGIANNNFGLLGMEERVTMLEGVFRLDSAPGAGTRVCIELPLNGPILQ